MAVKEQFGTTEAHLRAIVKILVEQMIGILGIKYVANGKIHNVFLEPQVKSINLITHL